MFGLISCRGTGFTGLLFITRVVALSVFPDYRLYRFGISREILGTGLPSCKWYIILTYPMSANQDITAQYLQITVCVGSPKHQGIMQYLNHHLSRFKKYQQGFVSYLYYCVSRFGILIKSYLLSQIISYAVASNSSVP